MITKVRLSILEPRGIGIHLRNAVIKSLFGMIPAAIHVNTIKTKLDRKAWFTQMRTMKRLRTRWTRPEEECLSAFVSFLNHCRF